LFYNPPGTGGQALRSGKSAAGPDPIMLLKNLTRIVFLAIHYHIDGVGERPGVTDIILTKTRPRRSGKSRDLVVFFSAHDAAHGVLL
jgi:hypothetical protein